MVVSLIHKHNVSIGDYSTAVVTRMLTMPVARARCDEVHAIVNLYLPGRTNALDLEPARFDEERYKY